MRAEIEQLIQWREHDPLGFLAFLCGEDRVWEKPGDVWVPGMFWSFQRDMILNVFKHRRVAVRTGHGLGKDFALGDLIILALYLCGPCKVVATSASWPQVEKILWPEVARAYRAAGTHLGMAALKGRLLTSEFNIDKDWFAIGLSTDDATKIQGFHAPCVFVIFDEAAGIRPEIWEGAESLMVGEESYWIAVGNPTDETSAFAKCFRPNSGWYPMKVPSWESPNVVEGREVIPGLVGKAWCEDKLQRWGAESPAYLARVMAEFPRASADTFLPLAWVEATRDLKLVPTGRQDGVGVDVARYGSNKSVITWTDGMTIPQRKIFPQNSVTSLVGEVVGFLREHSLNEAPIAVDDVGVGGGVTDLLTEQRYRVIPVIGNARPDGGHEEKFDDLTTQMWWEIRERLRQQRFRIDPTCDDLINQLTSRKYQITSKNKMRLESKEDMTRRGLESPDEADSLALALYASGQSQSHDARPGRNIERKKLVFAGRGGY